VSRLVGGRGAILTDAGGAVTASFGFTDAEAEEFASAIARTEPGVASPSGTALSVPMHNGILAVAASAYTPFFGREETEMLQTLAVLAELALARADLFARERVAQQQLAEAQQIAKIGSYEWDKDQETLEWSEEMFRIFGVDADTYEPAVGVTDQFIHPDDRARVESASQHAYETGQPIILEYRVVRPDGTEVMVEAQGKQVPKVGGGTKMVGTVQDITERKKQEVFREQFIANAAHELRTPMTTLVGFVEMLARKRHKMPEEQINIAVEAMDRSGSRLAVLINNLLDLSKLQQGELSFDLSAVPVKAALDIAVEQAPPPPGKNVDIVAPDDLVALADRHRLDQVISNLLTNAYRYGGANVTVEARQEDGRVLLSVSDDGEGVEEGLVQSLFDPFTRGASSSEVGGSGLGLAIVKMLVDASGGEIKYSPNGSGARFLISLQTAT
jgi:PAS domain S-box-containing protein